MGRVAPSVIAREQLQELLTGGVGRGSNIVSALVETVTRLVVQELLEGEQAEFLGGRGRYERRGEGQSGSRNGYEPGRVRTAEGAIEVAVPQVRGAGEPFRSSLMSFLDGNSEVLERLVTEMYARGLSTRDVEDAFRQSRKPILGLARRSQAACADSGAGQSALVGEAPYSSSVTWRPHVTGLPDSSFCCIAMWTMNRFGAAPCQWFSSGSKNTRSPG